MKLATPSLLNKLLTQYEQKIRELRSYETTNQEVIRKYRLLQDDLASVLADIKTEANREKQPRSLVGTLVKLNVQSVKRHWYNLQTVRSLVPKKIADYIIVEKLDEDRLKEVIAEGQITADALKDAYYEAPHHVRVTIEDK